jgi:hypothetical protein
MELIFEWDADKALTNFKKHGVGFEEAKTVFSDPWLLTYRDEIHSGIEPRFISMGYSGHQRLLVVVHTEHLDDNRILIRIISSRKAAGAERRIYEKPQA